MFMIGKRDMEANAISMRVHDKKILKQRFALPWEAKKAAPGCRGANSRLAFVSLNLSSSTLHEWLTSSQQQLQRWSAILATSERLSSKERWLIKLRLVNVTTLRQTDFSLRTRHSGCGGTRHREECCSDPGGHRLANRQQDWLWSCDGSFDWHAKATVNF